MKKTIIRAMAVVLALTLLTGLCACGKKKEKNGGAVTEDGNLVWYYGGNGILSEDVDPKTYFTNVKDTVDPQKIYSSVEFTEEMLYGAYTLNNEEKDVKNVRDDYSYENVEFYNGTYEIIPLPVAVFFGAEYICTSETNYNYADFQDVTEIELAVLKFATKDDIGSSLCAYEVNGNTVTFKGIEQTNKANEEFAYEITDVEFVYDFEICGPYFTFKNDGDSMKLTAFCFTENAEDEPTMSGYSLPDTPLIDELDYFSSGDTWNYAVMRNGNYYDTSAYKLSADGRFTAYLYDADYNGEEREFVGQYAYIIRSEASNFFNYFSVILLDGEKEYYYTDDITAREARILEEEGIDVNSLTDEKIEEIAEKKADLYDDLYNEFKAQGINVTVNRITGEISMDSTVLFGGDSAELNQEGKELLNKFLAVYTSIIYNEKYDGFIEKTMIEGHIAPIAGSTYESGLPLSEERANNVKDYCVSAETGVDTSKLASTLEAVGLSNTKPIYGANGEVDLNACRRVSFRFIVNVD